MINVVSKRCEKEGCDTHPIYGYAGEKATRCKAHSLDGMIDVKSKRCEEDGCDTRPVYGYAGEKATRCKAHL